MLNFQDTFETRKKSFISASLVYMTVPLINTSKSAKLKKKISFLQRVWKSETDSGILGILRFCMEMYLRSM